MSTLSATRMETVIPGLQASAPETLSFAPTLAIRAFLLERPHGNLLVYSAGTVPEHARAIEDLGGISRHYLNHWHEAGLGCERIAATFGAPLFCHENERQSVAETCAVAGTFSARHLIDDDLEAIPIPGHTRGATAFLWDSGRHRCLFTGDTIYLSKGEWVAAVLEGSSDRAAYIESLELIKTLEFDVLVPWAATVGQPFHAMTGKADAGRRIDAILERLRRGGDR
jgi:glyoxylase-like metal-dependent hydrolase (beta-lactamase superfamily II)